jgi:hypothetical protein
MNRWKSYSKNDTQLQIDGDIGFKGIDMQHERSFLQPGFLARCENKRLWDGPAATRPGTVLPDDFNPGFVNKIIGSTIYSAPNGQEVMLVAEADSTFIWQLQFGKDPIKVNLKSPYKTGPGRVELTQAYDKVVMLKRFTEGDPQLVWNGLTGNAAPDIFNPIVLSDDGLHLIPHTWFAESFENRVLYYYAYGVYLPGSPGPPIIPAQNWNTRFVASDILDYTSYDDIYGAFTVSAAESDQITRLLGYQRGALIVLMAHSVRMVENFTVDPTQTTQRVLTTTVGSVGNKVPLLVGREVFFLSEPTGFYKLTQIVQDEIAAEPIPISMPIQPIIDRINWERRDSLGLDFVACSAVLGVYCFFAVPLDGKSGANDAILVYNAATQQWESAPDWWDDADFRIDALHVTRYNQARRLFGLDYAAKKIYLLYDGTTDNINGKTLAIKDTIETRGYVAGDPGAFKRFDRTLIGLTTVNPKVTVTAISDGVGEQKHIATFTKDPTASYVHGRGPTTVDPAAPKLQDYSGAGLGEFVGQDFEGLVVGSITQLPAVAGAGGSGFLAPAQQSLERFKLRTTGRWCSIRVENTRGNCNIGGVAVEGIPVRETVKVVA